MGRRTAIFGVVLLCVLAGCNGFGGQDAATGEETVTPAPVPTVESEPAEGVSEDGIDAPAVAANHRAALVDRSYTTRTEIRWHDANGTTYTKTTVHRVEARAQRSHVIADYARPRGVGNLTGHELYHDGNQTFIRIANADGEEQFQHVDDNPGVDYSRTRTVNELFVRLDPASVERVRGGTTVVSGPVAGADGLRGLTRFREERAASMTARISPEGYVERIAIGFDATLDGDPVEARMTMQFTDVGSTNVTTPDWVDRLTVRRPNPDTHE